MKISLLIPIISEEEGIKLIMPRINNNWVDQILFVDGGSTDNSIKICNEMGYEVISQKEKGLNAAYRESWDKLTGDIVITFSPDNNSIPEKIPELVSKMKESNYDMVIVSRYMENAKSYDDSILTTFGNWFFTKSINLLFKGNYTDSMGMYRAYKKDVFYNLNLHKESSYKYYEMFFFTKIGVEPLLSIRAAKANLKIGEIPGDEPKRIGGTSKLQLIRWGCAYYSQVLFEFFFNRK